MAKIVVRLDDIHPRMRWEKFSRFCSTLERAGVTGLLGVIPDCDDTSISHEKPKDDFWDQLRSLRDRGWTIAQHGYRHVYDSSGPNYLGRGNRSEFAGHSYGIQLERIARGAKILADEGLASDIFMPPGHTFDGNTLKALRANGFRHVSDGYGIWPYVDNGLVFVPHLSDRLPSAWMPGVYSTSIHLNSLQEQSVDRLANRLVDLSGSIVNLYDAAAMRGPLGLNEVIRHLSGILMRLRWRLAARASPAS